MSQKAKIRLFLGISIFCWAVIACWAMYTHQQGSAVDPIYDTIHGDIYSTTASFQIYQGEVDLELDDLAGAIIPSPLNNPAATAETMAVLGHNLGGGTVVVVTFAENIGPKPVSGDWGWQGSYGVVQADKGTLDILKSSGLVINNKALNNASNFGVLADYFSYYLPGVAVIPVVLDEAASREEVIAALTPLRRLLDDYTILVAAPAAKSEKPLDITSGGALDYTVTGSSVLGNTIYSGILEREAALALAALGALVTDGANLSIMSHTEFNGETEVERSEYFSDLQIYYQR